MNTFIRTFIFILCVGVSQSLYANGLVGKTINLGPGTTLVRAQDNANVRLPNGASNVVLGDPSLGSNRKLQFPIRINGVTYYVREEALISMRVATQAECDSLRGTAESGNRRDLQRVARAASRVPIGLQHLKSPHGSWTPACKNFIQDSGALGSWGEGFLSSAESVRVGSSNALTVMMQPDLWRLACPGFARFSEEQKRHFIVAFIATKAQDESSCNANAYADRKTVPRMPNPPAVGFFQLEGQSRLRSGRHPQYCGGGLGGTQKSLPVNLQFSCAAYQIVETQWNRNRPFCQAGGYWQEANKMNGRICRNIRQYPGCGG